MLDRTCSRKSTRERSSRGRPRQDSSFYMTPSSLNLHQDTEDERKKAEREAARDKAATIEKLTAELRAEKQREMEQLKERYDRKYAGEMGMCWPWHSQWRRKRCRTEQTKRELQETRTELDRMRRTNFDIVSYA